MIRVLVFGITENPGGVESFLMTYYRQMDREKIQFDFLCNTYNKVAYEEELQQLGGRILRVCPRSRNPLRYKKELEGIFKEHASEWDAVWVNVCSLANIDYLKAAKKYGIKRRIIHSHNSQNMDSKLRGKLHEINRGKIAGYATDFWACTEDAAKWFYNEELMGKVVYIRNAIDPERYRFDEGKRFALREKLGITDRFVFGNIGRLHFQKNQSFAIEVFSKYLLSDPGAYLIFVGAGEDEELLKNKCRDLGITDSVLFAGVQSNIDEWLDAFDLFLFPSAFEGLGIALLEAQANGLPCLASADVIPKEVQVCDNFLWADLKDSPEEWAKKAEQIKGEYQRKTFEEAEEALAKGGYEIRAEVRKLEEAFLSQAGSN